jgi:hypothetical protein
MTDNNYLPAAQYLRRSTERQQYSMEIQAASIRGESYYIGFSGAPVSFAPYLDTTAQRRLAHQYLLIFLTKPEKKAGMRRVRLQTEVPNAELVAASQVYVPAAPQ